MNYYDQPAQAKFMNTYVPIPFEEMVQAGAARQGRQDLAEQNLESYYNQIASMSAIPGAHEQYLNQAMQNIDQISREYAKKDLSQKENIYDLKDTLRNKIDVQTLARIQRSKQNWDKARQAEFQLRAAGKYYEPLEKQLDPALSGSLTKEQEYTYLPQAFNDPEDTIEQWFNNVPIKSGLESTTYGGRQAVVRYREKSLNDLYNAIDSTGAMMLGRPEGQYLVDREKELNPLGVIDPTTGKIKSDGQIMLDILKQRAHQYVLPKSPEDVSFVPESTVTKNPQASPNAVFEGPAFSATTPGKTRSIPDWPEVAGVDKTPFLSRTLNRLKAVSKAKESSSTKLPKFKEAWIEDAQREREEAVKNLTPEQAANLDKLDKQVQVNLGVGGIDKWKTFTEDQKDEERQKYVNHMYQKEMTIPFIGEKNPLQVREWNEKLLGVGSTADLSSIIGEMQFIDADKGSYLTTKPMTYKQFIDSRSGKEKFTFGTDGKNEMFILGNADDDNPWFPAPYMVQVRDKKTKVPVAHFYMSGDKREMALSQGQHDIMKAIDYITPEGTPNVLGDFDVKTLFTYELPEPDGRFIKIPITVKGNRIGNNPNGIMTDVNGKEHPGQIVNATAATAYIDGQPINLLEGLPNNEAETITSEQLVRLIEHRLAELFSPNK